MSRLPAVDDVDAHPRLGVVDGGGPSQADDRVLRRDVRAHIRVRDEAGDIDGHDLVPGLLCLLQKRCGRRENAGVVERDVEAAELAESSGGCATLE